MCRSSGRRIHEAHFRHRGAPVSGFLRPSATVAAWHPGPAESFRGKASVRLGFARLHPRPGNGGDAAEHLPPPRQPAAARLRSRLSLSAWKSAAPTQAGPLRPKTFLPHPSASTACRRPSLCSDADLLGPLSALTLATGQVFTADHASCFIVPLSLP